MATDSFAGFLDAFSERSSVKELAVVNRREPDPVQRLLEQSFGEQVAISERQLADHGDDVVLLVEDGTVVATSSLQSVMDAFLMINSDLYRTGLSGVEKFPLPDVLAEMDEVVMRLRGFPATDKEKLLLIAVSRHIEANALAAGSGRLDAGLQDVARLDDEFGTFRVYERLGRSDVDVTVYGHTGEAWARDADLPLSIRIGDSVEHRRGWFVVYVPEDGHDGRHAALIAVEEEPNVWRSTWTFDPEWVRRIQRHVIETL